MKTSRKVVPTKLNLNLKMPTAPRSLTRRRLELPLDHCDSDDVNRRSGCSTFCLKCTDGQMLLLMFRCTLQPRSADPLKRFIRKPNTK